MSTWAMIVGAFAGILVFAISRSEWSRGYGVGYATAMVLVLVLTLIDGAS